MDLSLTPGRKVPGSRQHPHKTIYLHHRIKTSNNQAFASIDGSMAQFQNIPKDQEFIFFILY
jgi:hypothetical protein